MEEAGVGAISTPEERKRERNLQRALTIFHEGETAQREKRQLFPAQD